MDTPISYLLVLGPNKEGIPLGTRQGTPIRNFVELNPSEDEIGSWNLKRRLIAGPTWVMRKPASGIYNCAGMVWASRRTTILDQDFPYRRILMEDGYRKLSAQEALEVDDLVIYDVPPCGIVHVGRIVRMERITDQGGKVPIVLSKWNSLATEDFHHVRDVGLLKIDPEDEIMVEYWTDRQGVSH